jgi:hypothetical protein
MPEALHLLPSAEVNKGLYLLGLKLSEDELDNLQSGQIVSLESRCLGEIGSMLILATALSATNLGKYKQKITFQDLPKISTKSEQSFGLPIYCWQADKAKYCLYLSFVEGKLAIHAGTIFRESISPDTLDVSLTLR